MQPGAILIYHTGHLATDTPRRPDLQVVRDLMMALLDRRMIRLSQRRLADGIYEYRAEKSSLQAAATRQHQG